MIPFSGDGLHGCAEATAFLAEKVAACEAAGIARNRVVVDPGFGFGKTLEHNLALLRGLDRFVDTGLPVLVGYVSQVHAWPDHGPACGRTRSCRCGGGAAGGSARSGHRQGS
jgi:hypothetical protein